MLLPLSAEMHMGEVTFKQVSRRSGAGLQRLLARDEHGLFGCKL